MRVKNKIDLWHQRVAHVNLRQLSQLVANLKGVNMQLEGEMSFCEACVQGKMHWLPHSSMKDIKSKESLPLVHIDVCGPMQMQSHGGSHYVLHYIY